MNRKRPAARKRDRPPKWERVRLLLSDGYEGPREPLHLIVIEPVPLFALSLTLTVVLLANAASRLLASFALSTPKTSSLLQLTLIEPFSFLRVDRPGDA